MFPWSALERIDGLSATQDVWQELLGSHLPEFGRLCLKPDPHVGGLLPCPRDCGCYHRIIPRHDNAGAVAICRCLPPKCPDIELTPEQSSVLQVDRPRLGRALARALGCQPVHASIGALHTEQIGSWSRAAVPVFLTIQTTRRGFNHAVTHLAAVLRDKFIVLTPTKDLHTAATQQILAVPNAGIFDLESTIEVRQDGTLRAITPPEQLFAKFSPEADRPSPHSAFCTPKYALRKGLGVWHLIFDYQEADIRHEKGMFYVAWLLYHPDETPIHALDLMAKVPEIYRQQLGLPTLTDPTTGKVAPLLSGARLQERSLALDDRESMHRLYKKQKELEAILDSNDATEPEKAEALRELEDLYQFQRQHSRATVDSAKRAVWAVRNSIRRLQKALQAAVDANGNPHQAIHRFAEHLKSTIIIPSSLQAPAHPGNFIYLPTQGVLWSTA